MERKVAWSLQGKKVYSYRQKDKGQKYTLIGAISVEGVVCHKIIKGSMKEQDFLEFVKTELCPKLNEKKVVIMDNLNSHKAIEVQQMISQTGARFLILLLNSYFSSILHPLLIKCCIFIKNDYKSPFRVCTSLSVRLASLTPLTNREEAN